MNIMASTVYTIYVPTRYEALKMRWFLSRTEMPQGTIWTWRLARRTDCCCCMKIRGTFAVTVLHCYVFYIIPRHEYSGVLGVLEGSRSTTTRQSIYLEII